ncbi:MAG TPA: hypothetical protein VGV60_16710 [Candidatus Polarisedimenticolia bacterium]|nr:hypothetical protein [Candidatus Polarisedimenticolia bacterium]
MELLAETDVVLDVEVDPAQIAACGPEPDQEPVLHVVASVPIPRSPDELMGPIDENGSERRRNR